MTVVILRLIHKMLYRSYKYPMIVITNNTYRAIYYRELGHDLKISLKKKENRIKKARSMPRINPIA